ncbi:O-antigen ligase family protein [Pseudomonas sp. 7-41]|uniref:O-antigen ligase family protein n=1 Tax=Pseudomonas sp. 7-41 TaxID=2898483 RepID=UPI001E4F5E5B|nr:O-antigen ligase family protein [Pseudomonas sp. 7-41]UHG99208.1 O-antigen ligase family protein [Pseudomonas sp. 7-41]
MLTTITPTRIEKFAVLAFVLLFPGAFFYHVGTGIGYIPHVLGGYISFVGAVLLSVFLVNSVITTTKEMTIKKHDLLFYAFIFLFGLVSAISYINEYHTENAQSNFLLFINMLVCFHIFKNINITDETFKKTITASTLLMSATILYLSSGGRFSIELLSETPESVASYQTFAIAYICPLALTIGKAKSRLCRNAIFALGMICLYLNSARSEFVGFVILFLVFEASASKYRIITPVAAIALAAIALVALVSIDPEIADNRITQLMDLSKDESSNVRDEISREGFEKILASPIIGDYGNYEPGYYIHNILSAWQELGIFGFLYFLFLLYSPTKRFAVSALVYGDRSHGTALCLGMLAATIVLLIFGKYFAYPLVAVALGMASSEFKADTAIDKQES